MLETERMEEGKRGGRENRGLEGGEYEGLSEWEGGDRECCW